MHRVRSVEENWTSGTGLGFDISRIRDRTYVGHGGGYPGNTTQTLIQLDDKMGVIVLTNTNDSNPSDIAPQLIATVGQAVVKASASKPVTVTTTQSRSNHLAAAASDSSRRLAAAPSARSCGSSSRPGVRCGCTSATAGSIARSSCQ